MTMRYLYALALLSLAGCATSAPPAGRAGIGSCDPLRPAGTPCRPTLSAEARADDARADSLSRLDSLSTPDAQWLARYAVAGRYDPERVAVARDERSRERGRTVLAALGVVTLLGIVGTVWALQESTSP